MSNSPLVSVCIITYNHASFIREAIESVIMQKVNFSWEIIIADDFSTDGTREIISEFQKKYPQRIKLLLQKKNVGPALNWLDLMNSASGHYIAYLEGDDYWTNPFKLQKQVDFLTADPAYIICFGQTSILRVDGSISITPLKKVRNLTLDHFLGGNTAGGTSSTTLFRNGIEFQGLISHPIKEKVQYGDWLLYLFLLRSRKYKGAMLPETFGIYRQNGLGIYSSLPEAESKKRYLDFMDTIIANKILSEKDSRKMKKYRDALDSKWSKGDRVSFLEKLKYKAFQLMREIRKNIEEDIQ